MLSPMIYYFPPTNNYNDTFNGSSNPINNKCELPGDKLIDTASGASILSLQTYMSSLISNSMFLSIGDPIIATIKPHAFIETLHRNNDSKYILNEIKCGSIIAFKNSIKC